MFCELTPRRCWDTPHDLKLIAVWIGAVEALADAVITRPSQRAELSECLRRGSKITDRAHLPGQVVEPGAPTWRARSIWANLKESKIVMVLRGRAAHEDRLPGELLTRNHEAERLRIEFRRPLCATHVEDGVIQSRDTK